MSDERAAEGVDVAALVRDTRERQGLPATIRDPATLARIATLLDVEADVEAVSPA